MAIKVFEQLLHSSNLEPRRNQRQHQPTRSFEKRPTGLHLQPDKSWDFQKYLVWLRGRGLTEVGPSSSKVKSSSNVLSPPLPCPLFHGLLIFHPGPRIPETLLLNSSINERAHINLTTVKSKTVTKVLRHSHLPHTRPPKGCILKRWTAHHGCAHVQDTSSKLFSTQLCRHSLPTAWTWN